MGVLRILVMVAAAVILAFVGFYAYLGGFSNVEASRGSFEETEIIFAVHKGPYQQVYRAWESFDAAREEVGLEACDGLSVYLDGPETPREEARTVIGCGIDNVTEDLKEALRARFPSTVLPSAEAMTATFPYKNPMSFAIGPMKVFPVLQERMAAEGHEASLGIETYGDVDAITEMTYYLPFGVAQGAYAPLYDAFE
ncbi:MAG: hypothetical protein AAFX08_10460 [Pseudomonadota bacterium]